jgi:aminopeptidase Y
LRFSPSVIPFTIITCFTNIIMTILRTCTALACVAAAASARQLPMVADDSYPSYNPVPSSPVVVSNGTGNGTAIDTKKLQADIDIKKLVARAEELAKIADLSLPEYNHPTRVIGSKGWQLFMNSVINSH